METTQHRGRQLHHSLRDSLSLMWDPRFHIHPAVSYSPAHPAEDWDHLLQSLNTAAVAMSCLSCKKLTANRRRIYSQKGGRLLSKALETKQSPLRFQRAECMREFAAFPRTYEPFVPS